MVEQEHKTTTPKQRWNTAIEQILLNRNGHIQEQEDPFGEALWQSLLHANYFGNDAQIDKNILTFPLLSQTKWRQNMKYIAASLGKSWRHFRWHPHSTLFCVRILVLSMVGLVLLWALICYLCMKMLYRLLFVILMDGTALLDSIPILQPMVRALLCGWHWIDDTLCLGRRYRHRATHNIATTLDTTTTIVVPNDASTETMEFLQALQYCQTMLQRTNGGEPSILRSEEKKEDHYSTSLQVIANNNNDNRETTMSPRESIELYETTTPRSMVPATAINGNTVQSPDDDKEVNEDMPWLDVGAKIGMRLLNSEHVQRAMAQPDTILEAIRPEPTDPVKPQIFKPVHNLWTPDMSQRLHASEQTLQLEESHDASELRESGTVTPSSPTTTVSPRSNASPDSPLLRSVLESQQQQQASSARTPNSIHTPLPRRPVYDPLLPSDSTPIAMSPPGIERYPVPVGVSSPTTSGRLFRNEVEYSSPKQATIASTPRKRSEVNRRAPLKAGVKVAIPIYPLQPASGSSTCKTYQMGTVVSSRRIFIGEKSRPSRDTNAISVTAKLEKSFLRNGEFAQITFRVMDGWSNRYMPRHSKLPIGTCVNTMVGVGVLVGWRVSDDIHVVRGLWRNRGPGSSNAYLNRHALYSTVEAALGFHVRTEHGEGEVVACTQLSKLSCRFLVRITDDSKKHGQIFNLDRKEILSCPGAQFMPVIEHVREAAYYQIQVDQYKAALREQQLAEEDPSGDMDFMRWWADCADIMWTSFLKAVEEDKDFDDGVNEFMASVIDFLDRLDKNENEQDEALMDRIDEQSSSVSEEIEVSLAATDGNASVMAQEPGFWLVNDLFGGVFNSQSDAGDMLSTRISMRGYSVRKRPTYFDRAFALLRTLMKTVSIARASSVDYPHFRLALAVGYEFLLFVRTIVKIQKRNVSTQSLDVWKRAWAEIVATFGPIKERLERIGQGIALRMEQQGKKAKIRLVRFVDKILNDERLVFALEHGEWDRFLARIEIALVETEVIEAQNLIHYRKAARFVIKHIQMVLSGEGNAASRNTEKLILVGSLVQAGAAPRRSILKLFCRDEVLELFERILVRAYNKEESVTQMLTIHAANFHSLRQLRMLKDFSIAGRIWIPLLNAADEEFSFLVSNLPENSKSIMCPLSNLFSLCVAQFHKINAGDLSKDWLAFLLEEDSVKIIHDIDMVLILVLESFARDVREMMNVLPYYASIDDDILNLMDEVNLDEFLKEVTEALDDPEKFTQYVREKTTVAVERFLNYLPKMSIPVEKRDLGEGWVLTCHGADGGGLTLTDVTIGRDNLVCQVMGGDSLFFPMLTDEEPASESVASPAKSPLSTAASPPYRRDEDSVLDHIRELILNAQRYGCWECGVGGIEKPPTDRYAASVLRGLPVSSVLNTGIELWRNLEIDDDELLEIAIRDVAFHIELAKKREESGSATDWQSRVEESNVIITESFESQGVSVASSSKSGDKSRPRFNPRVDPTVLFLEIKKLSLNLDNFFFRIEKDTRQTIFDPVFEGRGMLSLQNVSIRLRVQVAKERVQVAKERVQQKADPDEPDTSTPILQLKELDISLDKLRMTVHDTGFGSDWILNKAVDVFEQDLTRIVEDNLKDKIREQVQQAMETLNSYFLLDPGLLLNILGIGMDDLDENVVWV